MPPEAATLSRVGTDDRIHSFNPVYTSPGFQQRFPAYAKPEPRGDTGLFTTGPFIVQQVELRPCVHKDRAGDHQGHIVPQKMLREALEPLVQTIVDAFADRSEQLCLPALYSSLWTTRLFKQLNLPFLGEYLDGALCGNRLVSRFDPNPTPASDTNFIIPQNNIREAVNGWFSIMIWNPVNICRAPEDGQRANSPGDQVDNEVIQYLLAHKADPGIQLSDTMAQAFGSLLPAGAAPAAPPPPDTRTVQRFIQTCNQTLIMDKKTPKGMYQFPWQRVNGKLIPA